VQHEVEPINQSLTAPIAPSDSWKTMRCGLDVPIAMRTCFSRERRGISRVAPHFETLGALIAALFLPCRPAPKFSKWPLLKLAGDRRPCMGDVGGAWFSDNHCEALSDLPSPRKPSPSSGTANPRRALLHETMQPRTSQRARRPRARPPNWRPARSINSATHPLHQRSAPRENGDSSRAPKSSATSATIGRRKKVECEDVRSTR
jgi:hypothetical protein